MIVGLAAFLAVSAQVNTYTTIQAGNWNNANTWAGGNIPPSGPSWNAPVKDIYIEHDVTLGGTVTLGNGYVRDIVVRNGATLAFGTATISENSGGGYQQTTFTVENGTVTANTMTINQSAALVTESNGTVRVSGTFTVNWNETSVTNAGTLEVHDFVNNGTFVSSGTLVVNGDFTNHYDFSASFGGNTTIAGNLTSNGDMAIPEGAALSVGGDFYLHNGKTADIDGVLNVEGDVNNNGIVQGDGLLQVDGETTNNGSIFANTAGSQDCTSGCGNVSLPVTLVSFDLLVRQQHAALTWATASETNNDYFTIEKSYDGEDFYPVATVPGSGDSKTLREYAWEDTRTEEPVYYRLRQTDYDGTTEVLGVKYAAGESAASRQVRFYPNPINAGDMLHIQGEVPEKVTLYNQAGKRVLEVRPRSAGIRLPEYLHPGLYLIRYGTSSSRIVVR